MTKILIIDDELDFGKLVKMNLELNGEFNVEIAENGKKGIAMAKKMMPDLILLDILMPGMNGFEVLRKLKADTVTIGIPVIMLSALEDQSVKIKAAQLYNEEYIVKPIEAPELAKKIKNVLRFKK
ncbi:MAG: response regulator [Candidatus Omnitrophota bacterium]